MTKVKKEKERNPCKGIPKRFHQLMQTRHKWEQQKNPDLPFGGYNLFMQNIVFPAWRNLTDAQRRGYFLAECKADGKLKPSKGVRKPKGAPRQPRRKLAVNYAGRTWAKNNCPPELYDLMVKNNYAGVGRNSIVNRCPDGLKKFDSYIKYKKKKAGMVGGCGCELCRNKLGGCACSKGWGECSNYVPSW